MSNEIEPVKSARDLGSSLAISNSNGGFLPAPANVQEAIDFAQLMAKAGPLVGAAFRGNPGACLAIYMQAGRLGMDPFALSSKAYLVNGNIAYEAQAVAAMVYSSPVLEGRLRFDYEAEGDDRFVTVTGRLKGDHMPAVYTSPRLAVMKEGGKSPLWKKDPDQQMAYYATRAWARRFTPDVLMGVYSVDEVDEFDMRNVTPRKDDAADRLTANLTKFEEDRNAGRTGLSSPDEADVQDAEVTAHEDAFEDLDAALRAVENAQTELEVQAVQTAGKACSWMGGDEFDTLMLAVANRHDALEPASA